MAKNTDEILGHGHECDGIEEYDNPLPDWWLGLFFVTVIWGGVYAVDFHFYNARTQTTMYEAELLAAAETWPDLNKAVSQDSSAATLALGQEAYTANCVACHGPNLGGGIGVNLVDTEWVHGGSYDQIVATITEGVSAKGMPAWGPVLGPKKVGALASFILSKNTGEAAAAAPAEPAAAPAEPAAATEGEDAPTEAVALVTTDDAVAAGKTVFTTNCVVCHAADMTGGVGPNLVDDEWIHGSELADIHKVVTNGVPAKGMITWKGVLSDEEIAQVSAYVYMASQAE